MNYENNVGKVATIARTDNPFAAGNVGKSGRIVRMIPSCEPTYAIEIDAGREVHAFARNVEIKTPVTARLVNFGTVEPFDSVAAARAWIARQCFEAVIENAAGEIVASFSPIGGWKAGA